MQAGDSEADAGRCIQSRHRGGAGRASISGPVGAIAGGYQREGQLVGLLSLLLMLAPKVIIGMEAAYKGLPKSGPFKLSTGIAVLGHIVESMLQAKAPLPDGTQIAEKSVSTDLLKGIIETTLANMKATGQLDGNQTTGTLYMVRGVVVPLNTI